MDSPLPASDAREALLFRVSDVDLRFAGIVFSDALEAKAREIYGKTARVVVRGDEKCGMNVIARIPAKVDVAQIARKADAR